MMKIGARKAPRSGLEWLFRCLYSRFSDQGPPLPAQFDATPGPGVLETVDTGSLLMIGWGGLLCNGAFGDGDPRVTGSGEDPWSFRSGLAFLFEVVPPTGVPVAQFGVSDSKTGPPAVSLGFDSARSLITFDSGGGAVHVATYTGATERLGLARVSNRWIVTRRGRVVAVADGAGFTDGQPVYSQIYSLSGCGGYLVTEQDVVDLVGEGFACWSRDWSEVTDSMVSPATGATFQHEAEMEARVAWTFESEASVSLQARWTDDQNCVRVSTTHKDELDVSVVVGGTVNPLYTSFSWKPGQHVDVRMVIVAEQLSVWMGGERVVDGVDISSVPESGQGRVTHGLSANDLTVSSHPHPALGPATSRTICPQLSDEQEMEDDAFVLLSGVTLPPKGEVREYLLRYESPSNKLVLKIDSDGAINLESHSHGVVYVSLTAPAGTLGDGGDLAVLVDGTAVTLWAGGVRMVGSLTHEHGRVAKSGDAFGGRFPANECCVWPVDMTRFGSLPKTFD